MIVTGMPLPQSSNCVNFRDVGEFVNLIAGKPLLPPKRLLRGGRLNLVGSAAEIGNPGTIINLRRGHDLNTFGADYFRLSIANNLETYDTADKQVRRWLNQVAKVFEDDARRYPVLLHCTSGKDRTGVAVAALLKLLDIPEAVIVEEYLLSDGEVRSGWIKQSLAGIGDPRAYFNRVDFDRVRKNIIRRDFA